MVRQLYRFQILREETPGVLAAIDEADQSSVSLVEIELDPDRRELQVEGLEKIAEERDCESCTAQARFYFVATSRARSEELLTATQALGLGGKGMNSGGIAEPPPQPVPPRSSVLRWILASIVVLAILIAIVRSTVRPSAASAPTLSPDAGTYPAVQTVAILDSAPDAVIHYTIDGSQPNPSSPVYSAPFTGLPNGTRVRAIATARDRTPSPEISGTYRWNPPDAGPSPDYTQGKYFYDHKRYPQARIFLGRACDSGEMSACNYLGYLYAKGWGGKENAEKAAEIYQRACGNGNLSSCEGLGSLYQDAGNAAEARRNFEKACAGGVPGACEDLHALK